MAQTQNIYIAITLEKTKIFFLNFIIVAGSLPHKAKKLGIKISHGCREIAFCPVGYFNLSHPLVHHKWTGCMKDPHGFWYDFFANASDSKVRIGPK